MTRHLIVISFKSSTGHIDHFSCKSSPPRSHLVAQKSSWQGEPFEFSKNNDFSEVLVILSLFSSEVQPIHNLPWRERHDQCSPDAGISSGELIPTCLTTYPLGTWVNEPVASG